MPIDYKLMLKEKGGDPDMVRASEKKRGRDGSNVDKFIEVYEVWRKAIFERDEVKGKINAINKDIGKKMKESKG